MGFCCGVFRSGHRFPTSVACFPNTSCSRIIFRPCVKQKPSVLQFQVASLAHTAIQHTLPQKGNIEWHEWWSSWRKPDRDPLSQPVRGTVIFRSKDRAHKTQGLKITAGLGLLFACPFCVRVSRRRKTAAHGNTIIASFRAEAGEDKPRFLQKEIY